MAVHTQFHQHKKHDPVEFPYVKFFDFRQKFGLFFVFLLFLLFPLFLLFSRGLLFLCLFYSLLAFVLLTLRLPLSPTLLVILLQLLSLFGAVVALRNLPRDFAF